MSGITRLTFEFPTHALNIFDEVAEERGVTRTALLRQGMGVIRAMHEASKDGLHTGFVRDRRKLDQVLVSPL